MAEGVGFEPTELSLNGFQDRRLKPLGHPSRQQAKPITERENAGQYYFSRPGQKGLRFYSVIINVAGTVG
jgi:hypothetical protein